MAGAEETCVLFAQRDSISTRSTTKLGPSEELVTVLFGRGMGSLSPSGSTLRGSGETPVFFTFSFTG